MSALPETWLIPVYAMGVGVMTSIVTALILTRLAMAGGPTENASTTSAWLVRPSSNLSWKVNLKDVMTHKVNPNIALEDGDILYLPKSNMAKFGYVLNKVAPLTGFALIGTIFQ